MEDRDDGFIPAWECWDGSDSKTTDVFPDPSSIPQTLILREQLERTSGFQDDSAVEYPVDEFTELRTD